MSAYEEYVDDYRDEVFRDMRKLGIEEAVIRRLAITDLTPVHDDQGLLEV